MKRALVKAVYAVLGIVACIGVSGVTVFAAGGVIAPIDSKPYNKTYGEWAADWWKWGLTIPANDPKGTIAPYNPLLGGPCEINQKGKVWFLAGVLGTTAETVYRTCTVPNATALFFPLTNNFCGSFLNDYPESRLLSANRTCANSCFNEPATFTKVSIDGVPVVNPKQYFEKSPFFEFGLPVDNIFGVTNTLDPTPMKESGPNSKAYRLYLTPIADAGYYLFLNPLSPGVHTIEWKVVTENCGTQDIHYEITVTK